MKDIFYQSSLPRSGSTLLQNILGQNPKFYVTPTSGLHDLILATRRIYTSSPNFKAQDSEEMKSAFTGFIKEGVKGYFENITDKDYVVDKSRGWINKISLLELIQENPKVVCIVRDPRAIFSSMEKKYQKHADKDLSNQFPQGFVQNKLNRVNHWANPHQFVGNAFNNLKELLDTNQEGKVHFVRYEDLMENPQQELDRIYDYLGLDSFKHNFKKIKQVTIEDDKFHGIFGDHKIKPELKKVPNDFEEVLGLQISNDIIKTYEWFYRSFNYM